MDSQLDTAQQWCRWGGTWKPFQAPVRRREKSSARWVQNLWRTASQHLHATSGPGLEVLILCQLSQSIDNNVGLPHPTVLKKRSRGQCVKKEKKKNLSGPQRGALGAASEKRGGVVEAARERLMVHINWGWFVWSSESGSSSQVCRGAGRQM